MTDPIDAVVLAFLLLLRRIKKGIYFIKDTVIKIDR